MYREYKKYGDISVRVMHEPDERVAYVYFRNFDDARDALRPSGEKTEDEWCLRATRAASRS